MFRYNRKEGKKFNGIINFIQNKSKEELELTASSVETQFYSPINVLSPDYFNYFHSKDFENSWICFVDHKIIPNSYEIKSYPYNANDQHPKSWVIEVSNDEESWFIVDDCSYLLSYSKI